jgi:hypothetical protein
VAATVERSRRRVCQLHDVSGNGVPVSELSYFVIVMWTWDE